MGGLWPPMPPDRLTAPKRAPDNERLRPMLLNQLHALQQQHGYLPQAELEELARRLHRPLYEIHGLATFYPHFRLTPAPALRIRLCQDLACYMKSGAAFQAQVEGLARQAGSGFELSACSCLGQCERAPAAEINGRVVAGQDQVMTALSRGAAGAGEPGTPHGAGPAGVIEPYGDGERYQALHQIIEQDGGRRVIAELESAGLRGMGGAGFPAGTKWKLVRDTPGDEKYVICNADESEPGTFKDRLLLERYPHLVLEGMLLGGYVTGARRGIVFLRHEYEAPRRAFERALAAARERGVIGPAAFGPGRGFEIELFISPGGYICGEETALLEALEGKRAEPRNKPPFPGTHGLFQRPTLINNVETFAWIPVILRRGADWWKQQGRSGCTGLKYLALSGDVERPGVYEVPLGLPVRELIEDHGGGIAGGRRLKAFAPGGASSGFLPAPMADIALDFKALAQAGSMLGSGAVVAVAEGRCMLDLALNLVRFFRNESCGKCVPCRTGSAKLVEIMERARRGAGEPADYERIDALAQVMGDTSICGLGQVAAWPLTSVIKHFPEELRAHLVERRCPERVCAL